MNLAQNTEGISSDNVLDIEKVYRYAYKADDRCEAKTVATFDYNSSSFRAKDLYYAKNLKARSQLQNTSVVGYDHSTQTSVIMSIIGYNIAITKLDNSGNLTDVALPDELFDSSGAEYLNRSDYSTQRLGRVVSKNGITYFSVVKNHPDSDGNAYYFLHILKYTHANDTLTQVFEYDLTSNSIAIHDTWVINIVKNNSDILWVYAENYGDSSDSTGHHWFSYDSFNSSGSLPLFVIDVANNTLIKYFNGLQNYVYLTDNYNEDVGYHINFYYLKYNWYIEQSTSDTDVYTIYTIYGSGNLSNLQYIKIVYNINTEQTYSVNVYTAPEGLFDTKMSMVTKNDYITNWYVDGRVNVIYFTVDGVLHILTYRSRTGYLEGKGYDYWSVFDRYRTTEDRKLFAPFSGFVLRQKSPNVWDFELVENMMFNARPIMCQNDDESFDTVPQIIRDINDYGKMHIWADRIVKNTNSTFVYDIPPLIEKTSPVFVTLHRPLSTDMDLYDTDGYAFFDGDKRIRFNWNETKTNTIKFNNLKMFPSYEGYSDPSVTHQLYIDIKKV